MEDSHLAAEKGNCCAQLMNAIYWSVEFPFKLLLAEEAGQLVSISAPAQRGQDLQLNNGGARRHANEVLILDQPRLTDPSSSCQLRGGGAEGYTVHDF